MRMRKGALLAGTFAALVGAMGMTAWATSTSNNGITLVYPSYPMTGPAFESCEPWAEPDVNTISLSGLPSGSSVTVYFTVANPYGGSPVYLPALNYNNVMGGSLVVPVQYPMNLADWPSFNPATNERAIAVAAFVIVNGGGVTTKLITKNWWVKCRPPLQPKQGCTPGYWKQDHHLDSWGPTGYAPGVSFEAVFGVDASFAPPSSSLLDAAWLNGGGEFALGRHAVAALLNAAHPEVNYQLTEAQVIAGVQNAYATGEFEAFKTALDAYNNAGCPLN